MDCFRIRFYTVKDINIIYKHNPKFLLKIVFVCAFTLNPLQKLSLRKRISSSDGDHLREYIRHYYRKVRHYSKSLNWT